MKPPTLSGSSGSSKTETQEQVQKAVTDALKSNDKVIEIRPANQSKGWGKLSLVVFVGGALAVASYWLRKSKSKNPADTLQSTARETADQTRSVTDKVAGKVQESGETMAKRIVEGSQKASEQVEETGEQAAEKTEQAGETDAEKAEKASSGSSGGSSGS